MGAKLEKKKEQNRIIFGRQYFGRQTRKQKKKETERKKKKFTDSFNQPLDQVPPCNRRTTGAKAHLKR